MSQKLDQHVLTKQELEAKQKQINEEALQILNNNFESSGDVFQRWAPVSNANGDKANKAKKDGEYEGMMKIISETEHVKVTNTIYQDIVDEAYVKEYELKADQDFAKTV